MHGLEQWAFTTAGVPERHNFENPSANPVIDEITDPAKMEPANDIRSWDFDSCSDARLIHQQCQCRLKILANGTGRGQPVCRPPLSGFFDLPLRSRLDPNNERQDQSKR